MIGTCAERLRRRISTAVSKPSNPGMLTSSGVVALQFLCAGRVAGRAVPLVLLQLGADRAVDDVLLLALVDDEDARALGGRHALLLYRAIDRGRPRVHRITG